MDFIFIFLLIISCNFLSTSFPDHLSFLLRVRTKKPRFQNALFEICLINPGISLINPEISLINPVLDLFILDCLCKEVDGVW